MKCVIFFKNNFIFVTLECDNSTVLKILNNNNINEQLIIFFILQNVWVLIAILFKDFLFQFDFHPFFT